VNDLIASLRQSLADRYTIDRELGQGGMATVFLAHDIKHDRRVALKVLKPELAAVLGADRFVVEIKTTASLQHPHILPLFDSGTADGFLFYVMPFIEGETLRSKLDRETQFGVEEAIRITCEIADALDYAHRHGVIHRDIKPENILLHDGRPMVADFGIALALSAAAGGRMTETGLSLGTPHYMSPEQATAEKEITGRSDIYSLASMLYEMLTGEPPHMGKSAQQIIMKIIAEPVKPVTELRKSVPAHVADAVAQALEKLPADRFASAADFSAALQGKIVGRTTVRAAAVLAKSGRWRQATLATGALAVVLAATLGYKAFNAPAQQVVRLSVAFPAAERVRAVSTRRFDISRDGERMVYIGPDSQGTQLWVRELNSLNARALPGTHDAIAPFFSPDGRTVGFIANPPGDIRVVPIDGGPAMTIVRDSATAWGAAWGDDGYIYFVHMTNQVGRVSASGGALEVVSRLDSARGESEHDWPQPIPGGRWILAQAWRNSLSDSDIIVIDPATGQSRKVADGVYARYLVSGHLLVISFNGSVTLAPFNARRGEVTGSAIGIADGVIVDPLSGSGQFAVSESGTLLYSPGGGAAADQIVWVDRSGGVTPVDSTWRGQFGAVALSPDGTRAAVSVINADGEQIWVKQLPRGPLTRLTFGSSSSSRPAWHPDNRRVSFVRTRATIRHVWIQRADGSAPAESLVAHPGTTVDEITWTPDGRTGIIRTGSSARVRDLMMFRPGVDSVARPFVAGEFDEFAPNVSPDGRWVAYVSLESGRAEIFVRRFDDPGAGRTQVSVDGGEEPLWAHNGRELFYRSGRGEMVVAEVQATPTFTVRSQRKLFNRPNLGSDTYSRSYDVTRDDQRFLMVNRAQGDLTELIIVLNWGDEVRRRQ
jgi:Tol biopolymer transport system component/tRNA A-37 threonylcarbamoyl transferase component Bud32